MKFKGEKNFFHQKFKSLIFTYPPKAKNKL